jgi:hypothetical protein
MRINPKRRGTRPSHPFVGTRYARASTPVEAAICEAIGMFLIMGAMDGDEDEMHFDIEEHHDGHTMFVEGTMGIRAPDSLATVECVLHWVGDLRVVSALVETVGEPVLLMGVAEDTEAGDVIQFVEMPRWVST